MKATYQPPSCSEIYLLLRKYIHILRLVTLNPGSKEKSQNPKCIRNRNWFRDFYFISDVNPYFARISFVASFIRKRMFIFGLFLFIHFHSVAIFVSTFSIRVDWYKNKNWKDILCSTVKLLYLLRQHCWIYSDRIWKLNSVKYPDLNHRETK